MVVVAVERLDVHARLGHPAGELAQLARDLLLEPLRDDLTASDDADARALQRAPGGVAIMEQKMPNTFAANHPGAAALDADPRRAQRPPHGRKRPWMVFETDFQIEHAHASARPCAFWPSAWWPCACLLSSGALSRRSCV